MFNGHYFRKKRSSLLTLVFWHSINVGLMHCFSKKPGSERVLFCCCWGGFKPQLESKPERGLSQEPQFTLSQGC